MEIEKPFKCNVCNSNFTNEDHLQVHKRRHEMSLNLTKIEPNQSQSNLDSFVDESDETPTPTRFFRNCEEVGLFQDLQNVNPFDEQFTKAASATPSTANQPFDFNIAISSSSTSVSNASSNTNANSKRRYSDQDTLNTPQIFIVNPTSTMPTSTTSLADVNSSLGTEEKEEEQIIVSISDSLANSLVQDQNVKIYQIINNSSLQMKGSSSAILNRNKTNLKLNLSPSMLPIVSQSSQDFVFEDFKDEDGDDGQLQIKKSKASPLEPEKKAELLVRNRAAASRSRQRRKQWVAGLESKCQNLESLLSQARAELVKRSTEIQVLRNELSRHANCDVTKESSSTKIQSQEIQLLVQTQSSNKPNILRSNGATTTFVVSTSSSNTASIQNLSCLSNNFNLNLLASSTHPILTTTVEPETSNTNPKSKRGRPKKGQERRLSFMSSFPSTMNSPGIPLKLALVPLNRSRSGDGTN